MMPYRKEKIAGLEGRGNKTDVKRKKKQRENEREGGKEERVGEGEEEEEGGNWMF